MFFLDDDNDDDDDDDENTNGSSTHLTECTFTTSKNHDFVESDFTPSKNYDFRFSREKLFEIKRGRISIFERLYVDIDKRILKLTFPFIILNLVFDAYDDGFDGVVSISHLEIMLRAVGLILTGRDIAKMKKEIDVVNRGAFELGAFFVIAARKFRDERTVDAEAKKAFLKISKNTLISGKWH
jgi:hypothetical protein